MDDYESENRAKIVAASGSGGSAQGVPPQMRGTLRFGESAFGQEPGGPVPPLTDDDGNVLVAKECAHDPCEHGFTQAHAADLDTHQWPACPGPVCQGSHIWTDHDGALCYCPGPQA